jgi:hypothetical protein
MDIGQSGGTRARVLGDHSFYLCSVAYWVSEQLIRNLSMVIPSYYELATYLYIPIAIYLCYLSCIIYLTCCGISSTSLEGPATN